MDTKQQQADSLHENINDLFIDLQTLIPADNDSRDVKQAAIFSVIRLRRQLDDMGLKHSNHHQGKY
jgi:hypothetical protein